MSQPAESTELRYDGEAISAIGRSKERLFDVWLQLATDHALSANRHTVTTEDVTATAKEALNILLEEAAGPIGAVGTK